MKHAIHFTRQWLSPGEVKRVLSTIETECRKLRNRTRLHPEMAHWNKRFPLPSPPLGKAFELASVDFVGGTTTLAFLEKSKPAFYERILDKLSPDSSVYISARFRNPPSPMPNLQGWLVFREKKVFLAAKSQLFGEEINPRDWVATFGQILTLAGIPAKMRYAKDDFVLEHMSGGELLPAPREKGRLPMVVGATLPGRTIEEIVKQYLDFVRRPQLQTNAISWSVHSLGPKRSEASPVEARKRWKTINQSGFPRGRAECMFFWYLKHYSLFKEMPLMTKLFGQASTQSLLDFEFGDAKQCQMDALCNEKGQYRLVFSFDGEFDHEELAKLLKLKLKEYD